MLFRSMRSVLVDGLSHCFESSSCLCDWPKESLSVFLLLTRSVSWFSASAFEFYTHERAPVSPPSQLSL